MPTRGRCVPNKKMPQSLGGAGGIRDAKVLMGAVSTDEKGGL